MCVSLEFESGGGARSKMRFFLGLISFLETNAKPWISAAAPESDI